jgi:UDP-N-acetylmuramyl pentapeptide phosphotransferase/UDP-N-acetylglucosamine-1-phosphate transferase
MRRGPAGTVRVLAASVAGAAVTWSVRRALGTAAPAGDGRWTRVNHRGEAISLLEGPAVVAGLLAGSAVGAPDLATCAAAAIATIGGASFGLVDDLAEGNWTRRKGLRGHLGALARGDLTTGGLKLIGISLSSVTAAALVTPRRVGRAGWVGDVLVSGALIATSANVVNLLDLRPGRALKAAALVAAPLAAGSSASAGLAAAALGASAAALPRDLTETDMMGDTGANALGALLGLAFVRRAPRPVRLIVLAGLVGLTAASERVSFTTVIEATPGLRELDRWGRRA